jgi:hypothetical protein
MKKTLMIAITYIDVDSPDQSQVRSSRCDREITPLSVRRTQNSQPVRIETHPLSARVTDSLLTMAAIRSRSQR